MDVLYFYKKTVDDFELRYSLRSIERHAPWTGKVWIYGDRPDFLTADAGLAEVVPDSFATAVLGIAAPVKNVFQMLFLSSLVPELSAEYVWCSDDHFLLRDYPLEEARKVRYLEDLRKVTRPAKPTPWKDQLWRTHDALVRLGYGPYNFETHTPIYLTKRRVLAAYCDLRDLVTDDRWYGLMGPTAILSHALKHDGMAVLSIHEEASRSGWGGPMMLSYEETLEATAGKTFLFLGDGALNDVTRRFLADRFPEPSRYEADAPAEAPG